MYLHTGCPEVAQQLVVEGGAQGGVGGTPTTGEGVHGGGTGPMQGAGPGVGGWDGLHQHPLPHVQVNEMK